MIWAVPEVGENHAWVKNATLDFSIPLVYLTMEPQKNITVVTVDNYQGGRMAMSHLLDVGYRNIGHISGPLDWWEARQRMAAWRDALTEAGLDASDSHVVEGNWSPESGASSFERLFRQYPEMDSIFVGNDQMALGVMQMADQQGLRIPEDIGIVGFDDITEAAFFSPALTTIRQDQHTVAKLAVEEIITVVEAGWREAEPVEPRSIILPPTLIVRQSSSRTKEKEVKPSGI
jgi:LacI family transcriptional regulator